MHAVALPLKERMLGDPSADDEVASWSPEWAGIALAGHPDLGAGVDTRRNAHADRLHDAAHTATETRRAPAAFSGARRPAFGARREPLNVQPNLRSANPLGEGQLGDRVSIVAPPSLTEGLAGPGHAPVQVVHLARGGIAQHPEGLGDLLEELTRALVPEVDVGRVLPREALIGPAHLARPGRRRDTQNRVVVATHRHLTSSCRPDPRSRRRRPRLPSGPRRLHSAPPARRASGPVPGLRDT